MPSHDHSIAFRRAGISGPGRWPLSRAEESTAVTAGLLSRDRHSTTLPHEVAQEQSYPWFKLWPKFQQKIWGFSESLPLLVTTDVTNYYDNIGFE